MSFVAGETVGPYRIIAQLGSGGMATVFKAYHPALDRYVAIKALHPAFKEEPGFLARFQREARVVAKLDHPNIVPIYDAADHEGRPYLVMKFIEGETLKARLERGTPDTAECMRIIEAVGSALAYAHKQGILHRDIKPSNVILAQDGQIYLADFGLARIAAAGESTLSSDKFLGTPQYISPEQAQGKTDIDEGADIYSFGVLIYEMLLGRVPFKADTPFAIIHDHIFTPLPLPSSLQPDFPEPVERVLLKALAKERAERFSDITSMVEAMRAAMLNPQRVIPADASTVMSEQLTPPVRDAVAVTPTVVAAPVPPPSTEAESIGQPTAVQAAPLPSLSAAETGAQPVQAETRAAKAPKAGLPTWLWIAMVLLLVLVIGFMGLRFLRVRSARLQANLPPPATQTSQPPEKPTAVPEQVLLMEKVFSLEKDGKHEQSLQILLQALDLAGDNLDFYMGSGKRLAEKEFWMHAAIVYHRQALHMPRPFPAEMLTLWHEAWYKAAATREFPSWLPKESLAEVDPTMADVCAARNELYNGAPLKAETMIAPLMTDNVRIPEAVLVQVETLIRLNRIPRAKEIIAAMEQTPELPAWVIQELKRIQSILNP